MAQGKPVCVSFDLLLKPTPPEVDSMTNPKAENPHEAQVASTFRALLKALAIPTEHVVPKPSHMYALSMTVVFTTNKMDISAASDFLANGCLGAVDTLRTTDYSKRPAPPLTTIQIYRGKRVAST